MPRLSSLRSFWTTARLGLALSLATCLSCACASAFGQVDYEAQDKARLEGMYAGPGSEGANGQQGSLINVASPIKRSGNFSSVGSIQALLYGDATGVVHFDLTKIDYEGLSSFLNDIVDKGVGSIRSDDKYSQDLREYQKTSLKSSFKAFLATIQNVVVQKAFNRKIDDIYIIEYKSEDAKTLGATVVAIPTDGLTDEEAKSALDGVVDAFEPIAVFSRYGFIVAVVRHDSMVEPDLEPINAKYRAKKAEKESRQSYGAYGSANSGSSSGYGAGGSDYGMGGGRDSDGGAMNGGRNSGDAVVISPLNELGLSADLFRDYKEEVEAAQDKSRTESRKQILPRIRNRFSQPATEEEAATLGGVLRQTNGAAITIAARNPGDFTEAANSALGKEDSESSPFSGLGATKKNNSENWVSEWYDKLQENAEEADLKSGSSGMRAIAVSASLVGPPRFFIICDFDTPESAQSASKQISKGLPLFRAGVQTLIMNAVEKKFGAKLDPSFDITPLIVEIFTRLEPQTLDTKVALDLDLEPIKDKAALFLPLLGGVESKSAKEMEAEEIDWTLGESSTKAEGDDVSEEETDLYPDEENGDGSIIEDESNEDEEGSIDFGEEDDDGLF